MPTRRFGLSLRPQKQRLPIGAPKATNHYVIAGPAVPMETRLSKEEFHGRGATEEEALQDCISKIKGVDKDSMFTQPPPMLPPSSVGIF
jgi:hypothetical protein